MIDTLRQRIRDGHFEDESRVLRQLIAESGLTDAQRSRSGKHAIELIESVRQGSTPGVMESFLAEYGLSTDEGVALMCLAEALLRVPDEDTIDQLIRDKIAPHDWGSHVGDSGSILINASTWALMLTGRVLDDDDPGVVGALQGLVRRLGEPVLRVAVKRAMQELGSQFVLGQTIEEAIAHGTQMESQGYSYSYDMLGEAARTHADADRYFDAYADAIRALARHADTDDIRKNPGISVKLSALHPRYEMTQAQSTVPMLSERLIALCELAAAGRTGLNIDAEEANRLEISLDIIESVLDVDSLQDWAGLGIVVQAYGRRARPVLDWIYAKAQQKQRKLMVRLVKGAYWDGEIKQSQVLGHPSFPVFTTKAATDVSYLCCASHLLGMTDWIYAQFATHNAHTLASIIELRENLSAEQRDNFEFQRLHGMGEAVHDLVLKRYGQRCRIYAPVGAHEDLLAYLVRRLLENGANSSFVSQIVDLSVSPQQIAEDPFNKLAMINDADTTALTLPRDIYQPERINSRGWDISHSGDIDWIEQQRQPFLKPHQWQFAQAADGSEGDQLIVRNPADQTDVVGSVMQHPVEQIGELVRQGIEAQRDWSSAGVDSRARVLTRVADVYEDNAAELFALLAREAGKTLADAIGELREAVDFLRYYAARAHSVEKDSSARGVIVCISPWNFPLAIFSGQIAAALVTGNAVIAKPAEQSPLIAARAVALMHEAGVPKAVLQLAFGPGETVGAALTADERIGGVCFTGSTEVARIIERQLAQTAPAQAMLIAETGGLNAMIVDSTALPEQAVRDILAGAFQSAGQRCSALRMLYLQSDRADAVLTMLKGAMETLVVGDPLNIATDVGPLIDAEAHRHVDGYIATQRDNGQLEKSLPTPDTGYYVSPCLIQVDGIEALGSEIFGPVLHYATFEASDLDNIIDAINRRGYGLTLGLHSRIDARVQDVIDRADIGNVYINRNQIGAIVGSQPFGGEGLSGTGPKAGGPNYLARFRKADPLIDASAQLTTSPPPATPIQPPAIETALANLDGEAWEVASNKIGILRSVLRGRAAQAMGRAAALECGPVDLPGPTGESNRLTLYPLGRVLCLNDDADALLSHAVQALRVGNAVVCVGPDCAQTLAPLCAPGIPIAVIEGQLDIDALQTLRIDGVAITGNRQQVREIRRALSMRDGPIVRLISEAIAPTRFAVERAVCIDTTAAGGNAELLAATG